MWRTVRPYVAVRCTVNRYAIESATTRGPFQPNQP